MKGIFLKIDEPINPLRNYSITDDRSASMLRRYTKCSISSPDKLTISQQDRVFEGFLKISVSIRESDRQYCTLPS